MACYSPLVGVWYYDEDEGKRKIKVYPGYINCTDAITARSEDILELPCGHCIGCRKAQSLEWSNRLLLESLYHDTAYFITLTYCDEYRPYVYGTDLSTGEANVYMSNLEKKHAQAFIKRLRYYHPNDRIRYYLAGEYGDSTDKCHFHAILFGIHLKHELIPAGKSETGQEYFRSPDLEEAWKDVLDRRYNKMAEKQGLDPNLLGFCSCEPANYYTFKYVSAYVTKKLGARPNEEYELQGRTPPFSLSSRNPGIGYQYYEDHPESATEEKIILPGPDGAVTFPPPRYFRKKLREADPQLADDIAERNLKRCKEKMDSEMAKTDLLYLDYLKVKENSVLQRVKARDKI